MAAVVVLAVVLPLTAALALRLQYAGTPSADAVTRGRDALWLGHSWVDGRKTPADATRLAATLRDTGVRDLYVHVGPLDEHGLDPVLRPRSVQLVRALHRALPSVRVLAWVGGVVGPGELDLDRPSVRDVVAAAAQQVLRDGFDGVHYDLEPVGSGDQGLLALLEATRAGPSALLSVAAPQLEPVPGWAGAAAIGPGVGTRWSADYLAAVARRVDQVVVMAYDTGLPLESLYGGYVARQTRLALRAVPASTDLLIGVPAFHDENPGHHAAAETVAAALRGVRLGLADDQARARFGVALYVDFAATDADWRDYRADWGVRAAAGRPQPAPR
ncbi:MAG TPA: glycosyl hydrolase family 18 protein [Candidatus Dormibacteraeota bacterium]|nr:glycosyl hydrolase family 18 protein [Candidatus Dormibacteraeota bacterium]